VSEWGGGGSTHCATASLAVTESLHGGWAHVR
jgi:hypothetical protein